MKSILMLGKMTFLLFACAIVFSQCCDDDVFVPTKCPEGYEGDSCNVEIPPKIVKITGIRILDFPETNSGIPWDPTEIGTGRRPDLQADFYLWGESVALGSTLVKENATTGITYQLTIDSGDNGIFLSDPLARYRVILYDFDGPLAHHKQQMTAGEINPYQAGSGFPSTITVTGASFVAELDLEYLR